MVPLVQTPFMVLPGQDENGTTIHPTTTVRLPFRLLVGTGVEIRDDDDTDSFVRGNGGGGWFSRLHGEAALHDTRKSPITNCRETIMRHLIAFWVAGLTVATLASAGPVTNGTDTASLLAGRFVNAIGHDDPAAARACWITAGQLQAFAARAPDGVVISQDKDWDSRQREWVKRDTEVERRLGILIAELKKRNLDLSKARLDKVTLGQSGKDSGMARVQGIRVVIAVGDASVEYELGAAMQFGDSWYCVKSPGDRATLIRNNQSETILCERPDLSFLFDPREDGSRGRDSRRAVIRAFQDCILRYIRLEFGAANATLPV
ncbi:MAG: hypothetical protein A2269_07770 [Lentisphaerae bacterium RIFOXYA12_FULL_60_10]|nr:MAG: hypothetical protein A2269_07770 [Lentisphaerae bacterium RIFOXYA12_FULL_60_10]